MVLLHYTYVFYLSEPAYCTQVSIMQNIPLYAVFRNLELNDLESSDARDV